MADSGAPRPSDPRRISHEIGITTLVSGERVINCWEIWMGGFNIPHRFPINDPRQARQAGEWAIAHQAPWNRDRGYTPVRSVDEVLKLAAQISSLP
ncbi:MAG TPA: hypothetical protein VJT31_28045 [Rugosimonospora sp.]|nr:hypothetical protein [Rugosimonospora sp.]